MANLIKKVKIKQSDGTYTDYIPIGAEASNVAVADGESVQTKLNKKPYYYNSVADMKADTKLKAGDMAITLGYYEPSDGGNGEYRIVSGTYTDDGGSYHKLNNNLFAELIIKDEVNVKQFGAYGDGIHDDTTSFHRCVDYAISNKKSILVIGTILISSSYELSSSYISLIITGNTIGSFRIDKWYHGINSRIKLINGCSLFSGQKYYEKNNEIPSMFLHLSNINFLNEYTSYNEKYQNQYIIYNIRLTASLIENISSECLNFMKGSLNRTSILKDSRFIACYIFMQCGTNSDLISDSVLTNNYISGSNDGYVFDKFIGASVRFENNFIDFFKYIFSPTQTGNTFLSSGNIYDGYFQLFEPTTNTSHLYANFISQNDKFNPHTKDFCISKGWMIDEQIRTSISITDRSYHLHFFNPQIRMDNEECFIYGYIYGPTSKGLKIEIINPSYWHTFNSHINRQPILTDILSVTNNNATIEQHFNNNQFCYQPSIIDRVTVLPEIKRNNHYCIPPFYKCYNITDKKLYEFMPSGRFEEVNN